MTLSRAVGSCLCSSLVRTQELHRMAYLTVLKMSSFRTPCKIEVGRKKKYNRTDSLCLLPSSMETDGAPHEIYMNGQRDEDKTVFLPLSLVCASPILIGALAVEAAYRADGRHLTRLKLVREGVCVPCGPTTSTSTDD